MTLSPKLSRSAKRPRTIGPRLAGALLALVFTCCVQVSDAAEAPLLEKLTGADALRRREAMEGLVTERAQRVAFLLRLIEDRSQKHDFNDRRHMAIVVLGSMRAVEAVDALTRQLDIKFPMVVTKPLTLGERYPAAGALAMIGSAAIPRVLARLAESDDSLVQKLGLYVLTEALDVQVAACLLDAAIAKETDATRRTRMERARKSLGARLVK